MFMNDEVEDQVDYAGLLEEPTYGYNHGRVKCRDRGKIDGDRIERPLAAGQLQALDFTKFNGFGVVDTSAGTHLGKTYGYQDSGMVSGGRSLLFPGEYVHHEDLLDAVALHLGFTFEEVRSVYHRDGGPLPACLRGLRGRIDDRLLRLHRDDHLNVTVFARVMGLTERSVRRALGRARGPESV